eukprot:711532-Pyramimonas_sp.AAC.1
MPTMRCNSTCTTVPRACAHTNTRVLNAYYGLFSGPEEWYGFRGRFRGGSRGESRGVLQGCFRGARMKRAVCSSFKVSAHLRLGASV